MSKVLVSLKIFPSDINIDLKKVENDIISSIPKFATVHSFEKEPIAFGLVALILHLLLPEKKSGAIEEIESKLKKIDSISDFQTLMVRRV
jgi:translation elongation factor aEF-1 beta